jgi:hypothetical protein
MTKEYYKRSSWVTFEGEARRAAEKELPCRAAQLEGLVREGFKEGAFDSCLPWIAEQKFYCFYI